jgi:hypothetical protein
VIASHRGKLEQLEVVLSRILSFSSAEIPQRVLTELLLVLYKYLKNRKKSSVLFLKVDDREER